MTMFAAALAVWIAGGCILLFVRDRKRASAIGVSTMVCGSVFGMIQAIESLVGPTTVWRSSWNMPFGELVFSIDALAALFLLPIASVPALAAIYSVRYMGSHLEGRHSGFVWFNFIVLTASMATVVTAGNALMFLLAWEVMSLASFFLVLFDNRKKPVRDAANVYLVATHLGTACLIVLFVLMMQRAGSMSFDAFACESGGLPAAVAGLWFVLAVIGFGTKAGFMPLHVWLPDAHPASPSYVSAVLSGVMIKTGIYGLLRLLTFLGPPPLWWGGVMAAIGISSGVVGVLLALAQHDLKRLLAYHSVENIGIIAMGIGVGLMGLSMEQPFLKVLGFGGALLHVINHAFFKGLLFLGAGAVHHATGTRDIDRLGGVMKRMPWTGTTFLIGSVAIAGLPPLNGFVSEFMVFSGALNGMLSSSGCMALVFLAVVLGLGMIGGLASACFAKAFGIVFLGEPRREDATAQHEAPISMVLPMLVLAAVCVMIGLFAPISIQVVFPAVRVVAGLSAETVASGAGSVQALACQVVLISALLFALVSVLVVFRSYLRRRGKVGEGVTWDCGYTVPSARMQYTASSFAQPLTEFFRSILRQRTHAELPRGLFPGRSTFESHAPDMMRDAVYVPVFSWFREMLGKMRRIQGGRLQLYVMYIVMTLVVLTAWQLWKLL